MQHTLKELPPLFLCLSGWLSGSVSLSLCLSLYVSLRLSLSLNTLSFFFGHRWITSWIQFLSYANTDLKNGGVRTFKKGCAEFRRTATCVCTVRQHACALYCILAFGVQPTIATGEDWFCNKACDGGWHRSFHFGHAAGRKDRVRGSSSRDRNRPGTRARMMTSSSQWGDAMSAGRRARTRGCKEHTSYKREKHHRKSA